MSNFELAAAMHLKTIEQQARIIAGLEPKVPEGYRLLPVVASPAIRDALVESGRCFEPNSTWAAIIAAHDLEPGIEAGRGFPERDNSKPAEQQGMFHKFDVRRTDGSSAPGGKHHGCRYFVLDLNHDARAPDAMRAYAASCRATHPKLADDIEAEFGGAFATPMVEPVKDAPESMANSNARFAIDGAIQYGRENRNAPPSADHWLHEYWSIGRQLATLGATGWDNVTPTTLASAPSDGAADACEWTLTDGENGVWESSCGEAWSFIDGGPKENRVRFCHGCGKPSHIASTHTTTGGEKP